MRTRSRSILAGLAVLIALSVGVSWTIAQHDKHDKHDNHGGHGQEQPDMSKMSPEEQKMMEEWMKYATPGAEHERMLKQFEGKWDAEVTAFQPGAPPQTSKGTMTGKSMFGGRYLHQMYKGEMMGMPFEGVGTMGYDNAGKKYNATWMDSMGTGTMFAAGTYDEAKKQYTLSGEMPDFTKGGAMCSFREVITVTDNDHHSFEFWAPGPDGKEMKHMEIKYTRAK